MTSLIDVETFLEPVDGIKLLDHEIIASIAGALSVFQDLTTHTKGENDTSVNHTIDYLAFGVNKNLIGTILHQFFSISIPNHWLFLQPRIWRFTVKILNIRTPENVL